jgi:hypothetical protein
MRQDLVWARDLFPAPNIGRPGHLRRGPRCAPIVHPGGLMKIRWDGGTRRSAIPKRVGVESSGLLSGNGRGWMWRGIQTRGTSHATGRMCSSLGKQPRIVDPAPGRHCGKRPSDGSSWRDTPCGSTGYWMGKGVTWTIGQAGGCLHCGKRRQADPRIDSRLLRAALASASRGENGKRVAVAIRKAPLRVRAMSRQALV